MRQKRILPQGTGRGFNMVRKFSPIWWQPRIGQRVKVTGSMGEHGQKYLGKRGEVIKNRGLGIFVVKLDSGERVNLQSTILRSLRGGQE